MSVDSTFKPMTATYLVTTAAVNIPEAFGAGISTFRVKCLAAAYITWGPTSSVTAKGAPAAGVPVVNTLGMATIGSVMYIEVPANSFFISSVATAFEVTGGEGGTGG